MKMEPTKLVPMALTAASGALFGGAVFGTVSGALSSSIGALAFTSKFTPMQKIASAVAFTAINLATRHYLVDQPIIASCFGLLPILGLRPYAGIGIGLTAGTGLLGSYALSKLAEIASSQVDPVLLTLLTIEVIGATITGACLPTFFIGNEVTNTDVYKFTAYTAGIIASIAGSLHMLCSTSHPLTHAGILLIPAGVIAAFRARAIYSVKRAPGFMVQLKEAREKAAARHKALPKQTDAQLGETIEELQKELKTLEEIQSSLGNLYSQ
jgi:hypothetical protein